MESIILQIAARHMRPILIGLSLVVLYRGHNEPGGGFIGGLMFGAAYILYAMGFGVEKTQKSTFIDPINLTAIMLGESFMTGEWVTLFKDTMLELKLGTPLLFDVGVYLTVAGMLKLVMFSIMEE
ncbi:MAG: MnhB domain-containing protein [Bacteroidota bacterium]